MERIEQVCERRAIPIGKLVQNNGQIDGVPKNPRTWEQVDVERLAKSIEETPELLDARGLIVVPHGGKFVVIGGNMRLTACRQLKLKEMPCMVLPESTDAEKLKAIAIKDNGSFGGWDFEALKLDDWDPVMLEECGVELSLDAGEDESKDAVDSNVKEDDFDESRDVVESRCKPGQIYELGKHRLMCGDSTIPDNVKKLLGGHNLTS